MSGRTASNEGTGGGGAVSMGSGGASGGTTGAGASSAGSVGSGGARSGATGGATGSGGATSAGKGGAAGGLSGSAGAGGLSSGTGGGAGTGTTSGSGGASGGSNGASSGGGTGTDASASGCPGIPIVPDSGGSVAVGSNSVGIHGSWFEYSDCADLKNVNCAMVTSPPANKFSNVAGKMCTSGTTSDATGAWGAGIALELNDGPPQQPYDTVAHGVKGFCFLLSGPTVPSTSVRVAFPTQDNNDNAYFEAVTTPGQHTVLFSDIAQGSWVTSKSAFEPTKVMLLQFQIPSSTTAPVPWNFCIDGLTAITE
ncbi:MAG TPA: hypothetical protein VFG23_03005 [Polyangia bacterium]|nr:hypothetical protein [Polyangia bacterium]